MSIRSTVDTLSENLITSWQVSVIGIFTGFCAVVAGAEPTGVLWADVAYVFISVVAVVLIGSYSKWWMISLYVVIATAMAFSIVAVAIGVVLYLVTFVGTSQGESKRWMKAIVIGISINLMFYSRWSEIFGLTSFIGLASNTVLLLFGLRAGSIAIEVTRKKVLVASSVFASVLFGLCLALLMAKEPLTNGNQLVRAGIAAVNQGDLVAARNEFDAAQKQMEEASRWLDSPLTFLAQTIPIVGQHRTAAAELSSSASSSIKQLSLGLSQFDLEKLRVVNGSLDLAAIQALRTPLGQILMEMGNLRTRLNAVQSPWLIGRIQDEFADLSGDLDEQLERGSHAQLALEVAPEILGTNRPQTYFVALTTPVEARGHGSFMGNWIELSIDAGHIEVTKYGRSTDLNVAGNRPRKITGPTDWLKRYGNFGFTNAPGGNVGENPWQNITMSPHFPSTAQVISELYPQSGGEKLDGVFAMDVTTLSALLEFAGPVAVEGTDEPLTYENATEFLLHDQYVKFAVGERIDLLASVTRQALKQILTAELPPPNIVANRLGPMISQGRLTGYSPNKAIQELFTRIGMSGTLTCDDTADCFAVTVDNASGNKIDYYLDLKVDYSVQINRSGNEATATAKITVTNSAPSTGLPDYVIGNLVGLPRGSNRMLLSIHSRLGYFESAVPTDNLNWRFSTEQGHNVVSAYLDVAPGESREFTVEMGGGLDLRAGYSLTVRNPPAVRPWLMNIAVVGDGRKSAFRTLAEAGTWVIP